MSLFGLYSYEDTTGKNSENNDNKASNGFELSIISTNMAAENEAILCNFLAKKISKGSVFTGSGTITNIQLPCNNELLEDNTEATEYTYGLYYCLIKANGGTENSSLEKDFEKIGLSDTSDDSFRNNKDIIVCFLHMKKVVLDLFHHELDQFSEEIYELYLSDSQKVSDHLCQWYSISVMYIVRCILILQDKLDTFLALASTNTEIEFSSFDNNQVKELKLFRDTCNIFEAYMHQPSEVKSITIEIKSNSVSFIEDIDSGVKSQCCCDLASALLSAATISDTSIGADGDKCTSDSSDPVAIKQMIQNYKLKVNHDMNLAKRLIIYAVNDFYALHRLYIFLRQSGNWKLILHHLTGSDLPTYEENEVIDVVREFLINENKK